MRILIFILFWFMSNEIIAQEAIVAQTDSTQQKIVKIRIGIVPSYSVFKLKGSIISFTGFGINLNVDKRLDARIFISFNLDNYTQELIFPSEHAYDQTNTGIDVSWTFLKKRISPLAGAMVNYSSIRWNPMEPEGEKFTDYLLAIGPYIGGNWNIGDRIRLQVHGGYNFSGAAELIGFDKDDFNSFYLETLIAIKIAEL